MKKIILYSFILSAFITITGCDKTKNRREPQYKYYNFCPDGPDLLILVDGWSNFPEGAAYKQNGGYYGFYPYNNTGTQTLKVQSKNTSAKYLETSIHMQDYYTYAIFSAGSVVDIDQLTIPVYAESSGDCKVRFVNLCPDCDTVKLTLNGTDYTGKVPYLAASDYVKIGLDSASAEIRKTNNVFVASERSIHLPSYRTVNIVLSGYRNAVNVSYLPAITVANEN